jgi:hypothetical protein
MYKTTQAQGAGTPPPADGSSHENNGQKPEGDVTDVPYEEVKDEKK